MKEVDVGNVIERYALAG